MYTKQYKGCSCYQNSNQEAENTSDTIDSTTEYRNMSCDCGCNVMNNDCSCGFDEDINLFPNNPMLAQSYVPIQYMDKTFKPCYGLKKGTIFPELVSPYVAGQSMEEINYLKLRNEIGEGCNR